ncbi:hypothetical protein ACQLR2_004769, partial [Escherichia coli]
TALNAEFTIGEGELMAHDVPLGCAPDEYDDLISGTCSHLPFVPSLFQVALPGKQRTCQLRKTDLLAGNDFKNPGRPVLDTKRT